MNGSEFLSLSSRFRPPQIPGLEMWLDGMDRDTYPLDGSNRIAQWYEKSGKNRHIIQATDGQKPTADPATTVKGIAAPLWTAASGTNMRTSGAATISQPNTMFAAFLLSSTPSNATLWDGSSSRQYLYFPNSTSLSMYANSVVNATVSSVVGVPSQVAAVYNGASSLIRLNRVQVGSGSAGSSSIGPEFVVGNNPFNNSTFGGLYAELIVYSGLLSLGQIMRVENYLAAKWGLL